MRLSTLAIASLFLVIFIGCTSFEGLIKESKFEEAEKFALEQKPDKQKEYFTMLADAYFQKGDYIKAGKFYETIGNEEGLYKIAAIVFDMKIVQIGDAKITTGENKKLTGAIIEITSKEPNNSIILSESAIQAIGTGGKIVPANMMFYNEANDLKITVLQEIVTEKNTIVIGDKTFSPNREPGNPINESILLYKGGRVKYTFTKAGTLKIGLVFLEKIENISDITILRKKITLTNDDFKKIADGYFNTKKYRKALYLYEKINLQDKIAECRQLLNQQLITPGLWQGQNISFIVSDDCTYIYDINATISNPLSGSRQIKIEGRLPISNLGFYYYSAFKIELVGKFDRENNEAKGTSSYLLKKSTYTGDPNNPVVEEVRHPLDWTAKPEE